MNAVLSWVKSPTATVVSYSITFTVNGGPALTQIVAQDPTSDANGYTDILASANPSDAVSGTIVAVDKNGLSSSPVSFSGTAPPPPPVAPQAPQNVAVSFQ